MEVLSAISSGTSTSGYVTKTKNLRVPAKSCWRTSLACDNWTIQQSRRECMVIVAGFAAKQRKAQLRAGSEQTMPLRSFADKQGTPQSLSQFLQQPAGMQSMLNTNHLQHFEYMGENVFRCYLPKISILGREVAPVMDVLVYASEAECVVEMIACKFEASDASGDKTDRFSANMKNHLQWKYGEDGVLLLRTNLNIGVSIEIHTLPFTMLPSAAVETPGNAVLQAIVDRMVPVFMQQLLVDYNNWAEEGTRDQLVIIPTAVLNSDHTSTETMPQ